MVGYLTSISIFNPTHNRYKNQSEKLSITHILELAIYFETRFRLKILVRDKSIELTVSYFQQIRPISNRMQFTIKKISLKTQTIYNEFRLVNYMYFFLYSVIFKRKSN